MSNTTRIGATALVVALVVLRFGHAVPITVGLAGAVVGLAVLVVGLAHDHRARQLALVQSHPNWAEEFTARVRLERAAAAAARETPFASEPVMQ